MNNVGEQINSVINNLADKLGVTANKLYPVLIKQSYVDGIFSILSCILGLAMVLSVPIVTRLIMKKDKDGEYFAKYWDDGWVGYWIGMGTIGIAGFLIMGCSFQNAITALINPDWYALQLILDKIK
jgi:hypothetical protein